MELKSVGWIFRATHRKLYAQLLLLTEPGHVTPCTAGWKSSPCMFNGVWVATFLGLCPFSSAYCPEWNKGSTECKRGFSLLLKIIVSWSAVFLQCQSTSCLTQWSLNLSVLWGEKNNLFIYLFIFSSSSSKCVPQNVLLDVHTNEYIHVHAGSTVILEMDVVEISVGQNTENICLNLNV